VALLIVIVVVVALLQPWEDGDSGEQAPPAYATPTQTSTTSDTAPKAKEAACSLTPGSQVAMTLPGCTALMSDTSTEEDPVPLWGEISCVEEERHQVVPRGGDVNPQASGGPQPDRAYRRLTTLDGDDFYGERCELGLNDHQDGPTAFYGEGLRRVTFLSVRLPSGFDLSDDVFQVVMQMKQAQPADNGDGTPVLALEAFDGHWLLRQSNSSGPSSDAHELWAAPAKTGSWTRFALDVTYSQDPTRGLVKVYADLNADGDFADSREQSRVITTYTLKVETEDGDDGLDEGDSIPSHLRVGLYHDPAYPCPAPNGCVVDLDNVQVVAP
jgi:hypothetical protein